MKAMKIRDIAQALEAQYWQGDGNTEITGIAVDSRRVRSGDLFFAMIGTAMDGHTFIPHALRKGASGLVVSRPPAELHIPPDIPVICVEDTHQALWNLAREYRRKIAPTVIGITGSVGKTTTKDMIAAVLETQFPVLKTMGNLNTEVGLPLTIFQLEDHHRVAVLEMGMRGPGQIAQLAAIAEPTIGIITNIGETHIEILGSVENIARAKGELLAALPEDGVAILNGDDEWCRKLAEDLKCRVYFFSTQGEGDVNAEDVVNLKDQGFSFAAVSGERRFLVHVNLPGLHNLENALAAVTTGLVFGIETDNITRGLSTFQASKMRMHFVRREDFTIINDAYNASPRSVAGALTVLQDAKSSGRMIAVLGDMLELGPREEAGHEEVGEKVAAIGTDLLITVGERARRIGQTAAASGMSEDRIWMCSSNKEAVDVLSMQIRYGDTILVKGSRGMVMEEIVDALTNIPPLVKEGGA
jgi:UDP-N-acetylmuramoyl-tripeptide--D-alanyl-D-alanine ligase